MKKSPLFLSFCFSSVFLQGISPGSDAASQEFGGDSAVSIKMGIRLESDVLSPLSNVSVVVNQGGVNLPLQTDMGGASPPFEVGRVTPVSFRILESPTTGGETVGQAFSLRPSDDASSDTDWFSLLYSVPEARNTVFDFSADSIEDTQTDLWRISKIAAAGPITFAGKVAVLGNSSLIESYFQYKGIPGINQYRQAMLIRVSQDVDLGPSGIALEFSTENIDYPSDPLVDAIQIPASGSSSTLAANLLLFFPPVGGALQGNVAEEVQVGPQSLAVIHLYGQLRAGDNLVLLSHPALPIQSSTGAGNATRKRRSNVASEAEEATHGTPALLVTSGCNAPPPPCDGDCDTDIPGLPAGTTCTRNSTTSQHLVAGPICLPAGATESYKVGYKLKLGTNVTTKLSLPEIGEISLGVNREEERYYEHLTALSGGPAGPGTTGHGQCYSFFECVYTETNKCTYGVKTWYFVWNDPWHHIHYKWKTKKKTANCQVVTVQGSSCFY